MKTVKNILMTVACVLLSASFTLAITPEKQRIEKKKSILLSKIRKTVTKTNFIDYIELNKPETVIVRCSVNDEGKVVLSNVIGFDEDLKKSIRKSMERKNFKASSDLIGEELALRITYKKHMD